MRESPRLRIGGFVPFSTVDDPDHLAAVVFCQGCPWRCRYCHNPHLQPVRTLTANSLHWEDVEATLRDRRGLLDSVVFSGGEPLMQRALAHTMSVTRSMGFRIGLHTAGISPRRLVSVLPLIDWVGFDVKAPFSDYVRITGHAHGDAVRASLACLVASGKPYEVRITTDDSLLTGHDAHQIGCELSHLGIERVVLQRVRQGMTIAAIPSSFVDTLARSIKSIEIR